MSVEYSTTVIICTYNGEKYIEEQLKSIINQTRKPNQIVLSDDCSTDRTVEIAKNVLEKSGIEYIINQNTVNLGITKNGTKGVQFCTGDLLIGADQDNVWDERFIEEFAKVFEADETLDYVFCNGYVTDENLNVIKPEYTNDFFEKDNRQFLLDAINKQAFPHGHTVVKKTKKKKSVLPYMFAGDEWLAICAGATGNIGRINKNLIYFRRHDSSFSFSEGGGKRNSIFFKIFNSSFDEYFVWPHSQYEAYRRYLELFENVLDEDVKDLVEKHMFFEGNISSLKKMGFFSRLKKILRLYKLDEYKLYRGNRNTLISDVLYLCQYNRDKKSLK